MPPPAALPTICTPSFLLSLRRHPHLPRHAWYLVAGVTLSGLNRPDELGRVLHHALEHGPGRHHAGRSAPAEPPPSPAEQLRIARKLREALVRASAIQGLPKAINALLALKRDTPTHLLDPPGAESPTGRAQELSAATPARVLERGQRFFDRTYGKVAVRVMGQMDGCGTEDLGAVARLAYGYVLSAPALLEPRECSFVLLAGLIPQDVGVAFLFASSPCLHAASLALVAIVSLRVCTDLRSWCLVLFFLALPSPLLHYLRSLLCQKLVLKRCICMFRSILSSRATSKGR